MAIPTESDGEEWLVARMNIQLEKEIQYTMGQFHSCYVVRIRNVALKHGSKPVTFG